LPYQLISAQTHPAINIGHVRRSVRGNFRET
jgi:hypothetical protein